MPKRIQLRRTKGWRLPEGAVSVARPTYWGNPVPVGCDFTYYVPGWTNVTAEQSVAWFRDAWLDCLRAMDSVQFDRKLAALRGRELACWCKPGAPCHADVLLEIANQEPSHAS